jgi:hypothetical protein
MSNGEYVVRTDSVDKYGREMLDAINAGRFADGGYAGNMLPDWAPVRYQPLFKAIDSGRRQMQPAGVTGSGPVDLSERSLDGLAERMLAGAGAVGLATARASVGQVRRNVRR